MSQTLNAWEYRIAWIAWALRLRTAQGTRINRLLSITR
ncbi:hypothetical protein BC937DRAFT_94516 [Endogone sp. FLAS-F59071]|nr:hypothetical protein BC937DRAFT_94516 [Endogone sp. FLAS-F59071]|eukprot:RUS13981.1 hypothetical protein BC937DRAFT_94516 [Endogone sp. FLAS-F59071]